MKFRVRCLSLCALLSFAPQAWAAGSLSLDFAGVPQGQVKNIQVEVWRTDGPKSEKAFRGKGADVPSEGLSLPAGKFKVYMEDEETGLIQLLDDKGKGFHVKNGQGVTVPAVGLIEKSREIKDKDKSEREEIMRNHPPKGKGALAVGDGDAIVEGGSDYAPGELLIKFTPETSLADRYQVLVDLAAENRSKLQALAVYRVKVNEEADLAQLIQSHAGDPRIKYIEMNQAVSIPTPVTEGE